jgi:DivIVA domain-containing protein
VTVDQHGQGRAERRLTPAEVRDVRLPRATMLRPGYSDVEVDRFLHRLADEVARLHAEKAKLRDEVRALHEQLAGAAVAPEPPSDQAVRILATAQQTADSYVAEAEDFSRQLTSDARAQYEEQLRLARENAGAIIHAAHETAARMTAGGRARAADGSEPSTEELEEQVAYLRAFGQACRTQLRAYLEALLADVETEWGRADPGALPVRPPRTPPGTAPVREPNVAREVPMDDGVGEDDISRTGRGAGVAPPGR